MDPFVPVSVPCYSEKEAYSCLAYYYDRNWIQHEAGVCCIPAGPGLMTYRIALSLSPRHGDLCVCDICFC